MPQESDSIFEGKEGKRFEEGVPLYFSVKSRAIDEGGVIIAEGTWSSVVNPIGGLGVDLELRESSWICADSSVGFQVLISPVSLNLFIF